MPFAPVTWLFKQEVTAAKLAQMVENLLVHDHRDDGSQGAAARGAALADGDVATAAAGWTLDSVVGRRLSFGGAVGFSLQATRTGGTISFGAGGGTSDVQVATLASGFTPGAQHVFAGRIGAGGGCTLFIPPNGNITLTAGPPQATIPNGTTIRLGGVLFR